MEKRLFTKPCSALNCNLRNYRGSELTLHRFPRNLFRCREWVKRCGNTALLQIPLSFVSKRKFLCHHHFTKDQYRCLDRMRLNRNALPSIFPSRDPCSTSPVSVSSTSHSLTIPSTSNLILICSTGSEQSLNTTFLPPASFVHLSPENEVPIQSAPLPQNSSCSSSGSCMNGAAQLSEAGSGTPDPSEAIRVNPRLLNGENLPAEDSDHESPPEVDEISSTISEATNGNYIRKYSQDPCHMIEEPPEVYMLVTLPHLEQANLNIQWVYRILSGEEGQDRVIYESACKDDKDAFMLVKDSRWDGINLGKLHLLAIPYRPGLLSLRDLNGDHLPLLKNIYVTGKDVIMEKYGLLGSELHIFLQYQPSFYHLHVCFTAMNDAVSESHFGKAHSLYSVINNIQLCPTHYQIASLTFLLKESDDLFSKFEASGLVKRIRQPS